MVPTWLVALAPLGMAPVSTEAAAQPPAAEALTEAPTIQRPTAQPVVEASPPPATEAPQPTPEPAPAAVTTEPAAAPAPQAASADASPTTVASPAATAASSTGEPTATESTDPASDAAAETVDADDAKAKAPRQYPRLVIAGGPMIGPHAIGNEECDSSLARCETRGSFFGFGGQLEVRARIWKVLYVDVRGVLVRNVSRHERIYNGLGGGALGLGAYGRRAFARAEYVYINAFGDNRFEPPFYDGKVATDQWGNHAGMLAAGFRQPLPKNLSAELWGGVLFGPSSTRSIPQEEPDERVLTTFMVGLNLAWDAWR
ncbi:MAG: hypothetical protein K0V04_41615 [Deltaproteobacteria bacterium]|nr:hypothetical protein [Deltaproteobacteria bacterium]